MKKQVILAAVLCMAATVARAAATDAYLYWSLDVSGKSEYAFSYATIREKGSSTYLSYYGTDSANSSVTRLYGDSLSGNLKAGPAFTGIGDVNYKSSTLFVELWNADGTSADPSATRVAWGELTYSQIADSIFDGMSTSGATPYVVSATDLIPEPTSGLLVLLGLAALTLRRKRVTHLVALFCCMAAVSAFAGANDVVLTFSSEGPDRYADGTTVLDGECYALVWRPAGSAGFAFAADGTAADSTRGEVVLTLPVAKGGRCPAVAFQIDAAFAAARSNGTWGLYLLDTRTVAANGAVSLAGTADGRARAVNAASEVSGAAVAVNVKAENGAVSAVAPQTVAASGAAVASTATAVPADAPQPTVKGIRVEGDYVYVTVGNTAPYLQYNLAAGTDPADLGEAKAAKNPVNGNAEGDIILVAPAKDGGAFFRVGRN